MLFLRPCSQATVWQHNSRSIYPKCASWLCIWSPLERGQETGLDEEVSEAQDGTENNPDQDMTDEEKSSDEEHGHAEAALEF